MSMLPSAPAPQQKRRWTMGATRDVAVFLRDHTTREYSVEQIAKSINLPIGSVGNSLTRLKKESIAQFGSSKGYWFAGPNAKSNRWESLPAGRVRPKPTLYTTASSRNADNGSTARVRAETAQLHDRDLMEVLRVREDGSVILIAENGDLYGPAHRIDV